MAPLNDGPRAWAARLSLAIFGATFAGLVASLLDALYALGDGGGSAAALWAIDAGLTAPASWLVGAAVGAGLVALTPGRAVTPSSLWASLDAPGEERLAGHDQILLLLFSSRCRVV